MTKKEQRLLKIMAIIFVVYAIPFELYPLAVKFYQREYEDIQELKTQIKRSEDLQRRAEYWQEQNLRNKTEREQVYAALLAGDNRDLLVVEIQRIIRDLATQTALASYSAQELPTFSDNTSDWLFITQKVNFEADATTLLNFFQALENAPQKLEIVKLYVHTSPRSKMLRGTVEIAGFARIAERS